MRIRREFTNLGNIAMNIEAGNGAVIMNIDNKPVVLNGIKTGIDTDTVRLMDTQGRIFFVKPEGCLEKNTLCDAIEVSFEGRLNDEIKKQLASIRETAIPAGAK